MRVAIFTDNDFDKVNGVTTTLKATLRFAADDIEPRVYTAAATAIDTPRYFATAATGIGLPWYRDMRIYWPRVRAFAREVRRQHTDVIHVTTPGPIGLAGRWIAAHYGLPLVGSYHTQLGDYTAVLSGSVRLGRLTEDYMRWFYGPCERLFVPSAATMDLLIARGYKADRLIVWGRGVDTHAFSPRRASAALRRHWHVDERRPAVLYAGRLSREKGLGQIEPIRATLVRHGLEHQFVFAGDGPMRAELEARCPTALFLGTLPTAELAVAMASADVFLFPSATDTMGNVVLEAQASGLPVVVSDRGGPCQNMRDGSTGMVCEAGSTEAFGAAMTTLLTHSRDRVAMGQQARQYAETRSWNAALEPLFSGWRRAARRRTELSGDTHCPSSAVHGRCAISTRGRVQ